MINLDEHIKLISDFFGADYEYVERKMIWKAHELSYPMYQPKVPGAKDAAKLRELAKPHPSETRHRVEICCHLVIMALIEAKRAADRDKQLELQRLHSNPDIDDLDPK